MKFLYLILLLLLSVHAHGHQPVMDMAPRWDGGYGIQTRVEHFNDTTTTWLEGVYTWDKSVRATFKLPYRDGRIGDLILGLPLKKYANNGAKTSNWSFTPSVQFPTGQKSRRFRSEDDAFVGATGKSVGGGEWDVGASLSYSSESPTFYQLYDLYSWGDRTGLDINAGFAFPGKGSGRFALWDVSVLTSRQGDRIQTGPVFVYFKKNMMFRAEYKHLVYERDSDWSGGTFNVGIGFVY